MTALHYAAFYAQAEIVQILLDAGAGKTTSNFCSPSQVSRLFNIVYAIRSYSQEQR